MFPYLGSKCWNRGIKFEGAANTQSSDLCQKVVLLFLPVRHFGFLPESFTFISLQSAFPLISIDCQNVFYLLHFITAATDVLTIPVTAIQKERIPNFKYKSKKSKHKYNLKYWKEGLQQHDSLLWHFYSRQWREIQTPRYSLGFPEIPRHCNNKLSNNLKVLYEYLAMY